MELCHHWCKRPIPLSSTRRYTPEQIRDKCRRVSGPFWLRVEDKVIQVRGEICLRFACEVSAAYHDWVAYNVPENDGFAEDMAEREAKIQLHMEDPSSEEEGGDDDEAY
jgi:hypothetical protein